MLAEDESAVATHAFRGKGRRYQCVLTQRRLIVTSGRNEDSYALSKIAAVKVARERGFAAIVAGLVLAVFGLVLFSEVVVPAFLFLLLGAGLIFLGWRGKTAVEIHHLGSDARKYPVSLENDSLRGFISKVNSTLS